MNLVYWILNFLLSFFSKIQDREHTDSMSYSWVLMRYTIVRLIHKRLWSFFPHIGIDKQGNSLIYVYVYTRLCVRQVTPYHAFIYLLK